MGNPVAHNYGALALRNAVFREEAATRGMVLCFVGGPNPDSPASWLAALRRFSTTRDLSSFGRLRYSFAEVTEHESTRVVTLWADTGLNLPTLFPKTGDANGDDSAVVPRPPGARRERVARRRRSQWSPDARPRDVARSPVAATRPARRARPAE